MNWIYIKTGIRTVLNKLPMHVAPVRKRDVAKAVAAKQGQTVTVVCYINPTAYYIPPYFIFVGKRVNLLLIKEGPIGCDMAVTDSGFMNIPTFIKYLQYLKLHTNPSKENSILLTLNNYVSHVSLEAILFAKENHIQIINLTPHSSHLTLFLEISLSHKNHFMDRLLMMAGRLQILNKF